MFRVDLENQATENTRLAQIIDTHLEDIAARDKPYDPLCVNLTEQCTAAALLMILPRGRDYADLRRASLRHDLARAQIRLSKLYRELDHLKQLCDAKKKSPSAAIAWEDQEETKKLIKTRLSASIDTDRCLNTISELWDLLVALHPSVQKIMSGDTVIWPPAHTKSTSAPAPSAATIVRASTVHSMPLPPRKRRVITD